MLRDIMQNIEVNKIGGNYLTTTMMVMRIKQG